MATNYVVIGGDAAGMSAAMKIRRTLPNAEITVFEMGPTFSYAQCGLPYLISDLIKEPERLIARKLSTFREKYSIDARPMHRVESLDASNQKVKVVNLENQKVSDIPYDKLLLATGAAPVGLEVPGNNLAGIFTLKTIEDAEQIKVYAQQPEVRSVAVVGGGYIGLEMVESFHLMEKEVHLFEHGERVAKVFDPEFSEQAREEMEQKGIVLHFGEKLTAFAGKEGRVSQLITENRTFPADLVLLAVGVKPNSDLLAQQGAKTGPKKAILVDEWLQTSLPNIYAAGDCATQFHRLKQEQDFIPLGTHANKQGRLAGANMAGGRESFSGILGTAILRVLDLEMARTGLSSFEAERMGLSFDSVTVNTLHRASYYPDGKKQRIKLLYEKGSNRLLGGQVCGYGVDKPIDIIATALYAEMDITQLEELDLAYAPPFSAVWAPVQQAARQAIKQ